jgi:hypothetical protein
MPADPRHPDRFVVRRKDGVPLIVSPRLPPFPRPPAPLKERVVYVNLTRAEKTAMFCWGAIAMGIFVISVGAIWLAVNG